MSKVSGLFYPKSGKERNHRIFLYGGFMERGKSSGKQRQNIRISCDLVGFIPVEELLQQETA